MNNPKLRRIAISVFAILLLVFVVYQAFGVERSGIRTETATYGTAWDSIEVSAVAIRSEQLLTSETGGVIRYLIPDGGHVAAGGTVAEFYENEEDVAKWQQIASLEAEADQLRVLNQPSEAYSLDPGALDENIDAQLIDVMTCIQQENWSLAGQSQNDLLHMLNQKDMVTGKAEDYSSRIAELEDEAAQLRASAGAASGRVTASTGGIFVSSADGYESTFDYAAAESLTVEDLKAERTAEALPEGVIGKLYDEFNWYLAFVVSADDAVKFKALLESYNNRVYLSLPFVSVEEVPAEVAAVNQETFDSEAAVILKCSYMDEALASIRSEEIEVEIESYSGVMVPMNAIHFATVEETVTDEDGNETTVVHENVMGVYRVNGASLEFVQVFKEIEINGYMICRTDLAETDILYTDDTISLYDEVVVEGKDLYDGKLVA